MGAEPGKARSPSRAKAERESERETGEFEETILWVFRLQRIQAETSTTPCYHYPNGFPEPTPNLWQRY
ncbi:hypothetical protein H0H81_009300 [Sphagnurus paluster]|uniref:Uncharacterized protein n=1 Tax=Sphagnurus paluster TaxID=117069 RepID=A0A9P7KL45_9AGAR|nr:hypothetical protein H0H81_009300 [Sphagnurus paluster]